MSNEQIDDLTHTHVFLGEDHDRNERRTLMVVGLTLVMMVAEITGGIMFGSMALLADGWHMSTHAAALGIAVLAYRFASKHANDVRFTFGTGKLGELAGFASAVILALIAVLIGYESLVRLYSPVAINYGEASVVALIGLVVNLVSAWLLSDGYNHVHHHDHGHTYHHHDHHHGDGNLRAAYLHVMADALTSVLAIAALFAGRFFGWTFLDPLIGIVGALVILKWSVSLLRVTGVSLLDVVPDEGLAVMIRARLEAEGDCVSDLHMWKLGPGHIGLIVSIVSNDPREPGFYKAKLIGLSQISHVTIEIHKSEHGQFVAA